MKDRLKLLEEELIQQMGDLVAERGFRFKPGTQSFRAIKSFGWASLHLAFIRHPRTDFDVVADVELRIDAVEALLVTGARSKSESLKRATVGGEFGNLTDGIQKRWTVAAESDVMQVACQIYEEFERVGIPYIERNSNLDDVLETLSRNDRSSWIQCAFHNLRCQIVVALAYVLRDYEKVDSLIEQGEGFLKARKDSGLPHFQEFVKRLRSLPAELKNEEVME